VTERTSKKKGSTRPAIPGFVARPPPTTTRSFTSFHHHRHKIVSMTSETSSFEVFLPDDITFDQTRPIAVGGSGDLFKGQHLHRGTLALKRLRHRIAEDSDPRAIKRVSRSPLGSVPRSVVRFGTDLGAFLVVAGRLPRRGSGVAQASASQHTTLLRSSP
jgi:hypothetical protein